RRAAPAVSTQKCPSQRFGELRCPPRWTAIPRLHEDTAGHAGCSDYRGPKLVGRVATGAMIGLGDAGMYELYHATDTKLSRQVTINILPPLLWRPLSA